ncbi:MAG: hypothetical protein ACLR6J_04635 [Parabacteroides merdae]
MKTESFAKGNFERIIGKKQEYALEHIKTPGTFSVLLRVTINKQQIMTDLFDKLYSQFLSGKTNRKDFEGFKESLNHLSDQELAERMEAFWNENTVYPPMEVCRSGKSIRLRLQIHPPKISIRWSRIVAAAAVIAVLSVTAWNFSLLHELQNANSSFWRKFRPEIRCS